MSMAVLLPTVRFLAHADSRDTVTVQLSKSVIQHVVRELRNKAAGLARELEEARCEKDPVDVAKQVTQALEASEAMVAAASGHLAALSAAIEALNGRDYDAEHGQHPLVAMAADAKRVADELAIIDRDAADCDLSSVIAGLESVRSQLTVDIATAKSQLVHAEAEVRRCNLAALAALDTETQRKRFTRLALTDLLPDSYPKIRGEVSVADVVAAKQQVEGSISARRMFKHQKRNEKRAGQRSRALERLDERERKLAEHNAKSVQQIAEVMNE